MTRTRRSIAVLLAIALLGALAVPQAVSAGGDGEVAAAAKKKKRCKTKKRAKRSAAAAAKKKRKKSTCKKSGARSDSTLPGQPTKPAPTAPSGSSASGSGSGSGSGSTTYQVSGVTLDNNPVLGGTGTQGEVTISEPAPSGGQEVALESADPARASVPPAVAVAGGQTTASFPVDTTAGATVAVDLTASIGSSSQSVQLDVVAEPSVVGVSLQYECFPNSGSFSGNSVTLDVAPLSPTVVTLNSSDTNLLTVDPLTTVLPGNLSAPFSVNTLLPTAAVSVTATAPNLSTEADSASIRNGSTQGALTDLSLSPVIVAPGNSSTGTVTLDCEAIAPGADVLLTSDNPEVTFASTGTTTATVTVPTGQLSADFQIDTTGAALGDVTITAELPVGTTRQAILTVTDSEI